MYYCEGGLERLPFFFKVKQFPKIGINQSESVMNLRKICFALSFLLFAPNCYAGEITVSAAASLTNAFTEVKDVFVTKYPEIKVYTNFASSNNLLKQINEGAPVDIFASADQVTMDKGEANQLFVSGSRKDFARNGLVLIVPFDAKNIPKSPQDLLNKDIKRIAIGNVDSVPAGRYAKEALESEKLWTDLNSRLVYAEHVRQVLDYVARGEVDAGFVYTSDALIKKDKVKIATLMQGHTPVLYPIALVKSSKNTKEAQLFLDFLFSDEGKNILLKYGFTKP